jgi:UDP-glucose 4-epimerase
MRYNLGNGQGFSVQQEIDVCKGVTQKNIPVVYGECSEGDSDVLVAGARLVQDKLGWKPKYLALQVIIEHAWQWEKKVYGN